MLGILQRDGRLLDFLSEDISGFSDADVGAAARLVHDGCKKVVSDYLELAPVRSEEEGDTVTVEAGFDAVELHMGHGYLLNQYISPLSNKRRDEYGGTAEKRARFPAEVLAAVKQAVGDRNPEAHRANLFDLNAKYADVLDLTEVLDMLGTSAEAAAPAAEDAKR